MTEVLFWVLMSYDALVVPPYFFVVDVQERNCSNNNHV
jgi:hypothetical protein